MPAEDPIAAVADLAGVPRAAAEARASIDALLGHRAMRRSAAAVAARSAIEGAHASARLAGASVGPAALAGLLAADEPTGDRPLGPDDGDEADLDPVLAGAVRVSVEAIRLAKDWPRTPMQVLARAHLLVAGGVAEQATLGRPRSPAAARRVQRLCQAVQARSRAPAVVVAAVVHAELLAGEAFDPLGDVVARAAERVVLVALGLDTKAVTVPEVGHLELAAQYRDAAAAYLEGGASGVAFWVEHCCSAYAAGAERGLQLADAVS